MPRHLRLIALLAPLAMTRLAHAGDEDADDPPPLPWHHLGPNLADGFGGYGLPFHVAAIATTLPLTLGGADHAFRVAVQRHASAPAYGDAAFYGGYVLPVLLPLGVYASALWAPRSPSARAGAASIQAVAVTVTATVVLKVATGRPFPMHGGDPHAPDRLDHPEYAREWRPFGFSGAYAWPSGHTAAAFAVAASLTRATESVPVAIAGYTTALGIGFGMIVGDHHWLSDVVAGACLGHGLGWSVGRGFARTRAAERAQITFLPLVGTVRGLSVLGTY